MKALEDILIIGFYSYGTSINLGTSWPRAFQFQKSLN